MRRNAGDRQGAGHAGRRSGMVLVLAVGVLSVLAVLAATLAAITRIESQAAKSATIPHQAHEAAMAGFTHAVSLLMDDLANNDPGTWSDHLGETWHTEFEATTSGDYVDIDRADPYLTDQGTQYATYRTIYPNSGPNGRQVEAGLNKYETLYGTAQTTNGVPYLTKESCALYDGNDAAPYGMEGHHTLSRWFVLKDGDGRVVGRYAVQVMDTQGRFNVNDWAWDNIGRAAGDRRGSTNQSNTNRALMQTPSRMMTGRMTSFAWPPHDYARIGLASNTELPAYMMPAVVGMYLAQARPQHSFDHDTSTNANMHGLYMSAYSYSDTPSSKGQAFTWRNYFGDLTEAGYKRPIGTQGTLTPYAYTIDRNDYNMANFISARGGYKLGYWLAVNSATLPGGPYVLGQAPAIPGAAKDLLWGPTYGSLLPECSFQASDKTPSLEWFLLNYSAIPHQWRHADGAVLATAPVIGNAYAKDTPNATNYPLGAINDVFTDLQAWREQNGAGAPTYKTSLTARSPININTASARVLAGVCFRDTLDVALRNASTSFYTYGDPDFTVTPLTSSTPDVNYPVQQYFNPFMEHFTADQHEPADYVPGGSLANFMNGNINHKLYSYMDSFEAGTQIRYPWVSDGYSRNFPEDVLETAAQDTPGHTNYGGSPGYWGNFASIPGFSRVGFRDLELVVQAIIANRPYRYEQDFYGAGMDEPLYSPSAGAGLKQILLDLYSGQGAFLNNAIGACYYAAGTQSFGQPGHTTAAGICLLIDNLYGDTSEKFRAMHIYMNDLPNVFSAAPPVRSVDIQWYNFPYPELNSTTGANSGPAPEVYMNCPTGSWSSLPPPSPVTFNQAQMELSGITITTELCTNAAIFEILVIGQATDGGIDKDDPTDDIPLAEVQYQFVVNRDPDMDGRPGVGTSGNNSREYDILHFSRYVPPKWRAINKFYLASYDQGQYSSSPHNPLEDIPVYPPP